MKTPFYLLPLGTVPGTCFVHLITFFYSSAIFLYMVYKTMFNPLKILFPPRRTVEPKILRNRKYGVHHFVQLKRVKLHYVANGPVDKPLMLLIHGFPEFWFSWRNQLTEFSKDYHVVAVDLPGYGQSEHLYNIEDYSIDKLVDDIRQLIMALGKRKAIVVAHGWGSVIAWLLAASHPKMVEKLVIINGPQWNYLAQLIENRWTQLYKTRYLFLLNCSTTPRLVFRSFIDEIFDHLFTIDGLKICSDDEIEAYKYCFANQSMTGPFNFFRALIRGYGTDYWQNEGEREILCPVLVVWGKDDDSFMTSLAFDGANIADNFNVKLIKSCSHFAQNDRPDLVNKYINEFLENGNIKSNDSMSKSWSIPELNE